MALPPYQDTLPEEARVNELFDLDLRRDKLHEQVADRVQELIVAQSLRPGDKLPSERELAEQLGISRTVVREAIRTLCERGLVEVKPGCGTYVQALNPKDAVASIELLLKSRQSVECLDNLYEIRRMIEIEVAGLAAERATEGDVAALEAAIEGMTANVGDPDGFTECDLAFHGALAAATHNDLFSALLSPISNLWLEVILISYHAPGAPEAGITHHVGILNRVKERDAEQARQAMRAHILESQNLVEAVRKQMGAAGASDQTN